MRRVRERDSASLVTAVLGGIFDTYTAASSLQPFLKGLNRYIYDTFQIRYFVTGIFVELDCLTGTATLCDMGHSYILVMEGKSLFRLGRKLANPPLGVARDLTPMLTTYQFSHGSRFILFTDGVVEQRNRQGEEYSQTRLWKMLKDNMDLSPHALRETLVSDFDSFRGIQPQGDDLTFLILKYR